MLILRLAIALGALAVVAGLLLWVITRDRRYLRIAAWGLQLTLVLVLAVLLWLFGGRMLAAVGL
jgi:hypothetical protein